MGEDELLYIEGANKRKLYYRFTPAALISNFVPLIVILHDEAGTEAHHHFAYKMWNVLTPIDNFGYDNKGSCWLGEKGDFFVKDLLQELIRQIAEEYECDEHIYLYGSGAGGYGAILHGVLCKANAVYAHTPRIRLKEIDTKENDLSNFLNPTDSFPIFYLCDNVDSIQNTDEDSLEDDIAYFAEVCNKHAIKVDLDHCPKSGYDEAQMVKKVLDMLERVTP